MVRFVSYKFRSIGGYRNPPPPRKLLGLMGLSGEERGLARRWRAPPCPNLNWTRGGGGAPLPSFLLSSSSFPPLLLGLGKGDTYSY